MIELSFQTRDVRTLCEDDMAANQRLGGAAAQALRHRIEDLRAASTVFDVLVGELRLDPASVDGSVRLIELTDDWVLRFRANHARLPRAKDGTIDWRRVSRIQVMDITRERGTTSDRSDA